MPGNGGEKKKYISFEPSEALRHLKAIWAPGTNRWFEIRLVNGRGARSHWFKSAEEAVKWLSDNWEGLRLWERHVFYGVLPRISDDRPRGAGNSSMVKSAELVFADIDYKELVSECGEGLRETEDGALEGTVLMDGKCYRIKRPPLPELLEQYKRVFGSEPYMVIDSGYGYHVFAKLAREIPVEEWRDLQKTFVDLLGGDPKSKDPARVLRVAGTANPKSAEPRRVRVLFMSDSVLEPDKLRATRKDREAVGPATLLAKYWVPGHRDLLTHYLAGFFIKAGLPLEKAKKIVATVARLANDEEAEKRVYEIERQYRLVAEGRKKLEEYKGKSGLVEELTNIISSEEGLDEEGARDKAIAIVTELEKTVGLAKSSLVMTPYESNVYIVNDPKRGILLMRARETKDGEKRYYRYYISDWVIKKVAIARAEGTYLYKVLFHNVRTSESIALSGQLDEIARELKRLHGVKRSQVVMDAVSSIISEFIKRGMARVRKSAAVAGIVPAKGGPRLVRNGALSKLLIPREPDPEKARRALELLAELRKSYDPRKFDVAINWAAYAPVSYALKKLYHVKQYYLLLHGEKQTGKTSLARIITSLFPIVTAENEEIPEEGQSEYRLSWKLNVAAVPLLEDEIQGISKKPGLLGLLKRASTGVVVRWRGDQGRLYKARAPLVFTSNYTELINDPALTERIISIEFTKRDYVYKKPREELARFKRLYTEYLGLAPHLGAVILATLVRAWGEVSGDWVYRLVDKAGALDLGRRVWLRVAEELGAPAPPWATSDAPVLESHDPEEAVREVFWEVLAEDLRRVARDAGLAADNLARLVVSLAEANSLPPYMALKQGYLAVTWGVVEKMRRAGVEAKSMRHVAELLGYEVKVIKLGPRRTAKAIMIPLKDLDF